MIKLKSLRKEHSLRQKDLAKILGITPQSVGYYENEVNKPDPEMLIKIADYFGVSVDYLLGREDDFGNITIQSEGESLTAQEKELLDGFRSLSPGTQEMILRVLTGAIQTERKKA